MMSRPEGVCAGVSERRGVFAVLLLLGFLVAGTTALKEVSVVIPPAARIMDTVTLRCDYDLEGEPLYTVKWYKGTNEFYRYIPKELPSTQVFKLPGVNVDLGKSSPNKLVLRNVQVEASGKYKCEVSSDAPNFYTYMQSGYMYVIEVPTEDPVLTIEKDLLEVGHTFKGNCSAPPSYPPANITWFLNGKKINESFLKRVQRPEIAGVGDSKTTSSTAATKRAPLATVSGVDVDVDERTFRGGKARLSCVATVFNLYGREKAVALEEDRPKPRPSSVLGNRESSAGSLVSITNTIVLGSVLLHLYVVLR